MLVQVFEYIPNAKLYIFAKDLDWSKLVLNHIFSALMAYVEIQKNLFERIFENVYRWQKKLFRLIIKNFIDEFILDKNHLLPQRIYK